MNDKRAIAMVEVETPFGRFIASEDKDSVVLEHLRKNGAQQRGDLELLMQLTRPGATVFDFGAHIGSMSIPLAHHVGQEGRVFAFEGSPDTFNVLESNIRLNGLQDRMKARHVVVAETSEKRFALDRTDDNRGRTQFREAGDEGLPAVSLDHLCRDEGLPPPDLIKIDVEGMEPAVIRGGMDTIRAHRPLIFFETNAEDYEVRATIATLKTFGYRIFTNTGERNTATARWVLEELNPYLMKHLPKDLLAIPPELDLSTISHRRAWSLRNLRRVLRKVAGMAIGRPGYKTKLRGNGDCAVVPHDDLHAP